MNILIFVLLCSEDAGAGAQAKEWLAGTECLFCLISKPFKS